MPIDEKRLPIYTNLYINVIKKEFKAHIDEINCITIINFLFLNNLFKEDKKLMSLYAFLLVEKINSLNYGTSIVNVFE